MNILEAIIDDICDLTGTCPECGGDEVEIQHYPGDYAVPECHYKTCSMCEHQWGHE